jgi:hypothetical protein
MQDNPLDGGGPRRRGVNGANVLGDTSSFGSSSTNRGVLPTRGPVPRNRSGGGSSSGTKTPPLASGRTSTKPQTAGAILRPVAGGPNVGDGTVVGLSRAKASIPDSLMSKVRRSSSASSIADEEGGARLVGKGPSFGSVGDLLTGAVVKRKAAKD